MTGCNFESRLKCESWRGDFTWVGKDRDMTGVDRFQVRTTPPKHREHKRQRGKKDRKEQPAGTSNWISPSAFDCICILLRYGRNDENCWWKQRRHTDMIRFGVGTTLRWGGCAYFTRRTTTSGLKGADVAEPHRGWWPTAAGGKMFGVREVNASGQSRRVKLCASTGRSGGCWPITATLLQSQVPPQEVGFELWVWNSLMCAVGFLWRS